jgi:hypothetical protein
MLVAVTSGRCSPGATSLAVGLAFAFKSITSGPATLIEADPHGGGLLLRFGLPTSPSLATLAGEVGRAESPTTVAGHLVDFSGVATLTSPLDPLVARWSLDRSVPSLVRVLPTLPGSAVIDLGRLSPDSPAGPLAAGAAVTLMVTRPYADEVQSALYGIRSLRAVGARIGLVVVGDKPYHPAELAELAGIPLIGVLPDDWRTARALAGGHHSPRRFHRSLLWRSIYGIAQELVADLGDTPSSPDSGRSLSTEELKRYPPPPNGAALAGRDEAPALSRERATHGNG